MTDLPLFDWQPDHACQIIAFPADKRVGKARHVAKLFASKGEKTAQSYWRTTTNRLYDQLIRQGVDASEAERQITLFRLAVERELVALSDQVDSEAGR